MKKMLIIIIIVIACLIGLGMAKNFIIQTIIDNAATNIVGAPVQIGGIEVGIFTQVAKMRDFKLYNPPDFPDEVFLDMPEISVNYDLGAILKNNLHLREIRVNLQRLIVIKNKNGKLNVDSLKFAKKEQAKEPRKQEKAMPMQIDLLYLTIGQVIYKDYTKGEKPSVEIFDVVIKDKVYKNITSAEQLTGLLLVESMKPTAIKSAKIYGLTSLAGVAFLPAAIGVTLAGKDSAHANVKADYAKAYKVALKAAGENGIISRENESEGIIKASVNGANVAIKISRHDGHSVNITISARKYLLPKPEIAKSILYDITEKLK